MLMTNLRVEVYASQREAHKNNDLGFVRLSATSQFGTRILPKWDSTRIFATAPTAQDAKRLGQRRRRESIHAANVSAQRA